MVTVKYEVERNNFPLEKYLKTMCWEEYLHLRGNNSRMAKST
jgi:hypothetical protein